ncbi:FecCD family ABC transporter permease [Chloroflexota bacterium]
MRRVVLVLSAITLLLILGFSIGVMLGPADIASHRLISAIFLGNDSIANVLVWDMRIPRVISALVVGSCIGVSGFLLQSSTRNPLGDPQLFGVTGGAAIVQALAMAGSIQLDAWSTTALSVVASLLGASIIAFFASHQGLTPARLALIGVSLSALAAALATGILAEAGVFSMQSLNFLGGSFANRGWKDITPVLPYLAIGLALTLIVIRNLRVLDLGDRVAANLGAQPIRTRVISVAAAGILGGAAVAVAGLIGFVGLIVPHIARLLVGHDLRSVLIIVVPLGAIVMLYADQAARLIFMPSEVPVGLVTAIIGAPLMIYVARRVL